MSSAFPPRPPVDHTPSTRSVADLTADAATAVFEALGSETARAILTALEEEPAPASDVADRVDTTLQNVQYHLANLQAADLVVAAGTWYSDKGREMTVYAPAVDRLELRLGGADEGPSHPPERRPPAATLND